MSAPTIDIQLGLQKMPDEIYHKLPLCSKHSLDTIAEFSPAHLAWQRKNPRTPTDAMRFGSAFHTFMLEPDEFTSRHPIAVQCSAILKSGKNAGDHCRNDASYMHQGAGYCGTHKPQGSTALEGAISRDDFTAIEAMAAAIHAQPSAALVMQKTDDEDDEEVAVITERDVNGYKMLCRGKIDIWRPRSLNAMADIKTTTNASPDAFQKECTEHGYFRQAAFYFDLCAAVGRPVALFTFIAIEKSAPYGCACYTVEPNDPSVEVARDQNRRLMEIYARCEQSNHWPSYPETFNKIVMSPWAMKRAMQGE